MVIFVRHFGIEAAVSTPAATSVRSSSVFMPRMRISLGLTTSTRWATARKWSRRYVPSSFRSLRRALSANRRRLSGV